MNNTLQIKVIDKSAFTMNDVYILNSSDSYGVGNGVHTIAKNGDSTAVMTPSVFPKNNYSGLKVFNNHKSSCS
jgi:hypothetical protein